MFRKTFSEHHMQEYEINNFQCLYTISSKLLWNKYLIEGVCILARTDTIYQITDLKNTVKIKYLKYVQ